MKEDTLRLLISIFFGLIAGFLSFIASGSPKKDPIGVFIVIGMFYICKFVFKKIGLEVKDKSAVESFFTILISWYFFWTIFLNF